MKYGTDICSGLLFVQDDFFTACHESILFGITMPSGMASLFTVFTVCLEEKRPRVTMSLRQPLRSSFPP